LIAGDCFPLRRGKRILSARLAFDTYFDEITSVTSRKTKTFFGAIYGVGSHAKAFCFP
jgi:hypothetical protein